jgi:hypothetical protein
MRLLTGGDFVAVNDARPTSQVVALGAKTINAHT